MIPHPEAPQKSPRRKERPSPWRLGIKTFRKVFFIIYSRRLKVNQEG
jgi:hypothetical protein